MTPAERARLAALAEAATPGPWRADDQDHRTEVVSVDGVVVADLRDHTQGDDAAFIAASRAAVPELLAALTDAEMRAEARLARLEAVASTARVFSAQVHRHAVGAYGEPHDDLDDALAALKGGE